MRAYIEVIFVTLGFCLFPVRPYSQQRFDGYYNNEIDPPRGGAGKPLMQNVSTAYADYTYKLSGQQRPSPRYVSEVLFRNHDNATYLPPSFNNRTALFAFFGQVVERELIDTDDTTCPVELLKISVPKCDPGFDPTCKGDLHLPYERAAYDKDTGQSPNAPRRQINKATSYIDASFIYGTSIVRAMYLKAPGSPRLATGDTWSKYPEKNDIRLPFVANPDPVQHKIIEQEKFWKLGDRHVQENPAILTFSIILFRWHNHLVEKVMDQMKPDATHDEIFDRTRQWVMATMQNIIVYEWLPLLIGQSLPEYSGYKSDKYPDVTSVFDAAAVRYIMTLIPSGLYQRDDHCRRIKKEKREGIRLCNSYWRAQDILMEREDAIEELIMGLTTQLAEAEDTMIVEDLQSKYYGPLHFSRHDYVSLTIMRGRDYGLPDYNTVRRQMGLKPRTSWEEINPWMNRTDPEQLKKLERVYGNIDDIDVFVGGMFETTPAGPGPLFTAIILDQFTRIRDGDRFWFENMDNRMFTAEEIKEIKSITLRDIILNSTQVDDDHIQTDVFTWSQDGPCLTPKHLTSDMLEPCTPHKGFDYFAGSEATYIIIWVSFGLIPFLCVFVAYILTKCKQWRYHENVKTIQKNIKDSVGDQLGEIDSANEGCLSQYKATEWLGDDDTRPVVVRIQPKCNVDVISLNGKRLRTLNLQNKTNVQVTLSNNRKCTTMLIKDPKEYDLVLQFPSDSQRKQFLCALGQVLTGTAKTLETHEIKLKHVLKKALTQKKRNQLLEKFFKTVFSEAFQMDYDPQFDQGDVETRHNRDILEIELTKEEFASALAVKSNSDFVENMFSLMDTDRNGYISFREFLNAVVMLSKGSGQDKLETLFRMFDLDGNGFLDRDELLKLFSSLLEMANSNLTRSEIETLVESICHEHGLTSRDAINFEDFCSIMSPQMDKLWNAGLEWKGCKNCLPGDDRKRSVEAKKRSVQAKGFRKSESLTSVSSASNESTGSSSYNGSNNTEKRHRFVAIRETYTPLKAKMRRLKHFIENNRQHIFYLVIFFGICIGVFAERFYFYTVEREHSGLRALMSYGISSTRGAAAAMSFTFSLLLLTMLRNAITFFRGTFLNLYVPFDSAIAFHKVVAWTALFFTGVHVIGYSFNFYQLATQPTKYLCVFDSIVFRADILPKLDFWFFGNATGFTGILLVVIVCIIYVFATQTARRFIFNAFWLSHKLIAILYVLCILHGASMVVQKPMFYTYLVVPAVLFTIDKMISLSRKRMEISIVRAENLASDVTYIEFKRPPRFEYKSGQWVRIACLAQGRNEYHPFTLTSAPHEDTLSVHIRALGPWTYNLRNIFDHDNLKSGPYPKLFLDGPYGAGQQDWYQYDVSVLVGAGIGVTPYASILKDFVHMTSIKSTFRIRCQKLYFIWITGSQRHFEWLLDILQEVEEIDQKGMVSIDIFITQFFQNFDLRTAMLYVCEEHFLKLTGGKSVFTNLKANTHFGRPHLGSMFQTVHKAHPMVRKIGVFSCGPPGVTKSVERACVESSRSTRALFEHHFENF